MERKYEFTDETKVVDGRLLHRIRALRSFGDVGSGDLGGWIEKESNLSHVGKCWVYDDSIVCDNAQVRHNARITDNGVVMENAIVSGNGGVSCESVAKGYSTITDHAFISYNTTIDDHASLSEWGNATESSTVSGNAIVSGTTGVHESYIGGNMYLSGTEIMCIEGNAYLDGDTIICRDEEIVSVGPVKAMNNCVISFYVHTDDYLYERDCFGIQVSTKYFTGSVEKFKEHVLSTVDDENDRLEIFNETAKSVTKLEKVLW